MKQPIVIIGMHRSGTSLLARILKDIGVFMGKKLQGDHESTYFLDINEWIFQQANASWDNPYNMNYIDDYFIEQTSIRIIRYLKSFRNYEYFGYDKKISLINFNNIKFAWGWKDPRNTFTIDIWKKIFPKLKIIHIYRNPIDVANSLRVREEKVRRKKITLNKLIKDSFLIGNSGFSSSVRTNNIYQGVCLWSEYTEKAFSCIENYDGLNLRYESFLENPKTILSDILSFIEFFPTKHFKADEYFNNFDRTRKNAFLKDQKLVDLFLNTKKDDKINLLMNKCSYDSIL